MRYRFVPYVVVLALWTALNLAAAQEAASERGLQRLPIKDANGREVGLYTGSFALVIGVSDYDEWTDLPGVRDDVPQVRAALEKHGFHVTVVKNPTGTELRKKLRAFIYARLCTNLVKSVRVTGRLHQALQIDPRDFYPLGIGR